MELHDITRICIFNLNLSTTLFCDMYSFNTIVLQENIPCILVVTRRVQCDIIILKINRPFIIQLLFQGLSFDMPNCFLVWNLLKSDGFHVFKILKKFHLKFLWIFFDFFFWGWSTTLVFSIFLWRGSSPSLPLQHPSLLSLAVVAFL